MPFFYKNGLEEVKLEKLNEDELFDFVDNIPYDSDDDLEDIDENDLDNSDPGDVSQTPEDFLELYYQENDTNTTIIQPSTSSIRNPKQLLWKEGKLTNVPCTFNGTTTLPENLKNLQTPFQFFKYFFDEELMDKIVEESIRYNTQKSPESTFSFTKNDFVRYLGVTIITSIVHMLNIRMYWSSKIGLDIVKNAMNQKTFEKIRSILHFNDNSLITGDKLQKIRPLIRSLSSKFSSIPMTEMLSVHEQICSTNSRHHLKQYMPLKPNKWGFKLFILSDVTGFCYKFEIYTGTENKQLAGEPDLGASSNVVVRLTRDVPVNNQYKLYFDNYYTSIPLINYLAKRGIHTLGTVTRNKILSCKMPSESHLKKMERGQSMEFLTDFDGTTISNTIWKDNKVVMLLSSFIGSEPTQNVQRYDRKKKERIQVTCPAVVRQYNKHKGGDLLDSFLGKYRIKIRSRKWYIRLFHHLLDIIITNAWLLYKRCNEGDRTMKLVDFRLELASTLCNIGSQPKRGRPTGIQKEIQIKKKKPNVAPFPSQDVRQDRENHLPRWNDTRLRCKYPKCKLQTFIVCEKCNTALCFNKEKKCFVDFHKS